VPIAAWNHIKLTLILKKKEKIKKIIQTKNYTNFGTEKNREVEKNSIASNSFTVWNFFENKFKLHIAKPHTEQWTQLRFSICKNKRRGRESTQKLKILNLFSYRSLKFNKIYTNKKFLFPK
jgi:hypothetical protein